MVYGDKRDYKKIYIFVKNMANGQFLYKATTTWSRTCKEARERYANTHELPLSHVIASYQDQ
jgi:hypothetical protein